MVSERTRKAVDEVRPLIEYLTVGLEESAASEVASEIKTIAQSRAQGAKCSRGITALCGRCQWIGEKTGLQEGICDVIVAGDMTPHLADAQTQTDETEIIAE